MNFQAAIAELAISAENCEHNAPIHFAEGNGAQAQLALTNAANYRAAIACLKAIQ